MAPAAAADAALKTPLLAKSDGAEDVPPKVSQKAVPFTALYRYASRLDIFAMVIAVFASLVNGAAFPLLGILFGQLLNALQGSNFVDEINKYSLYFLILAIICGFTSVLETVLPIVVAARQVATIRTKYVSALLRQEMAWFDTHSAAAVLAAFPESSAAIQAGIGEKLTDAVRYTTQLLTGLILGFVTSWKLTLVISALAPIFATALTVLIITNLRTGKQTSEAYARAGGVASEVLAAIRTVFAYGGETHEAARYRTHVLSAAHFGIRKGVFIGMCVGVMVASFYLVYGVSLFAGAHFIVDSRNADASCKFDPTGSGCYNGGTVIKTLTCVLIGATSFSQLGVLFGYFSSARMAAAELYELIDRVPTIDPFDNRGERPRNVRGRIEFQNVTFAYPSRPNAPVLRDFSLVIEAGQRVGVCGPSGSGKSTLVLLLLRFYDVQSGAVLVDGLDVRRWNLRYLRDTMGLVQQEPVLFGSSIRENIACGQAGLSVAPTDDEIYDAARAANADAFISALPAGYNTVAGTGVASAQLSGGQRQRICIARALLRNPRILLLDEATSALDSTSEREVQAAIDATTAAGTRTAVIIAHRLSTLAQAQLIVVMRDGAIIEQGSHSELVALSDGLFRQLLSLQDVSGGTSPVVTRGSTAAVALKARTAEPVLSERAKPKVYKRKAGAPGGPGGGDEETTQDVVEDVTAPDVPLSRIWGVLAPEWPFAVLGAVCAAAGGAIQPAFALVFASMTNALFNPDSATVISDAERYLIYFALLAFGSWCIIAARLACFTLLGERITERLRVHAFAALMAQPIAYFDDAANSPARLASKLASDASLVKGAAGEALGTALEGFFAVAAAMAIALDASWRLGLVVLAVFPLLAFAAVYEFRSSAGIAGGSGDALEASLEVTSEAVTAIRTVAAFNLQWQTLERFGVLLRTTVSAAVRQGTVSAGGRGLAQFVSLASYSLAFWAGAIFIERGEMPRDALLKVFLAASLSAQALGRITSFSPDAGRARAAARNVFKIIDSVSNSSASTSLGDRYQGAAVVPSAHIARTGPVDKRAHIEFRDVTFTYPARPGPPALTRFSLSIPRGATVALVGESGSGKSTVVALFERFYEPDSGVILVDGVPLASLEASAWRDRIGLVQQEPTLWADSIAYNISYGRRGRAKPAAGTGTQPGDLSKGPAVSPLSLVDETLGGTPAAAVDAAIAAGFDPDVVHAARDANALSFVASFKNGFATFCGARGGQLSGGQKQRVAIARALVRDPQYLLLDEATSALDTQSEAVVQAALDRLLRLQRSTDGNDAGTNAEGSRTTLVVAHRLSTVAGADLIVAMRHGAIVEQGTHTELMSMEGGYYRQLVLAQSAGGAGVAEGDAATGAANLEYS